MAWNRWSDRERRALWALRKVYELSYPKCASILSKHFNTERTATSCSSQVSIMNGLPPSELALKMGFEPSFYKANEKLAKSELYGVVRDTQGKIRIM